MCIYVQYMRTYYFLVLAGLPEKMVNSKIVNMISTVE